MNNNFINDIINKSYFNRKEINKSYFNQKEINKKKYKKDEYIIMNELTNKYYYKIIESIKHSLNNHKPYCILNFEKQDFTIMPITYSNLECENNLVRKSISELGLGSPQTIAYKWLRWLTNINNKYLKVNDIKVPYLGNPISYSIIPPWIKLIKCDEHLGPLYKRYDDDTVRDSILIEFRWDEIPNNKKRYFHSSQDINNKWNTNPKYDNRFKKEVSVKDLKYLFEKTEPFTNNYK